MKQFVVVTLLALIASSCSCAPTQQQQEVRLIRYVNYNPRSAESVETVSCRFGVSADDITEINPELEDGIIIPGKQIKIPISESYYTENLPSVTASSPCGDTVVNDVCGARLEQYRASLKWELTDRSVVEDDLPYDEVTDYLRY